MSEPPNQKKRPVGGDASRDNLGFLALPPSKRAATSNLEFRGRDNDVDEDHSQFFLEARNFVLSTLKRSTADDDEYNDTTIWEGVPEKLKQDPEIALEAFKKAIVEWDDLPEALKCDRATLLRALDEQQGLWYQFPQNLKTDLEFARRLIGLSDVTREALIDALNSFPSDRVIWCNILLRDPPESDYPLDPVDFQDFLHDHGFHSEGIFDDFDLMHRACLHRNCVFGNLDHSLQENTEFFVRLFSEKPSILFNTRADMLLMHPDLVAQFISKAYRTAHDFNVIPKVTDIPGELWESRRDIVLGWLRGGGRFLFDVHARYAGDKDMFLTMAKVSRTSSLIRHDFRYMSPLLKRDKTFMMQLVSKDPFLFWWADSKLRNEDFELLVVAFGSQSSRYPRMGEFNETHAEDCPFSEYRDWLQQEFEPWLIDKLTLHGAFCKTILPAISLESCSPLHYLEQDTATSLSYKRLIADFLGVPRRRKLRRIRLAIENLMDFFESYDFF